MVEWEASTRVREVLGIPSRKRRLPLSQDQGVDQQLVLVDQVVLHERLGELARCR